MLLAVVDALLLHARKQENRRPLVSSAVSEVPGLLPALPEVLALPLCPAR